MNSLLFENLQLMHESKFNRKIMKESVNTKYAYEIYLNSLSQGNLVGDNGDKEFNSKDKAHEDALNFITSELSKEYSKPVKDFKIKVYKIEEKLNRKIIKEDRDNLSVSEYNKLKIALNKHNSMKGNFILHPGEVRKLKDDYKLKIAIYGAFKNQEHSYNSQYVYRRDDNVKNDEATRDGVGVQLYFVYINLIDESIKTSNVDRYYINRYVARYQKYLMDNEIIKDGEMDVESLTDSIVSTAENSKKDLEDALRSKNFIYNLIGRRKVQPIDSTKYNLNLENESLLKEDFDPSMPSWLARAIKMYNTNSMIHSDINYAMPLDTMKWKVEPFPEKGKLDNIGDDEYIALLIDASGDEHKGDYIVYFPAAYIGNYETIYINGRNRRIDSMSLRALAPYVKEYAHTIGYVDAVRNVRQKQTDRGNAKSGSIDRIDKYDEYNYWNNIKVDKSGYIVDPNKYVKLLAQIHQQDYANRLEDLYVVLSDVKNKIKDFMSADNFLPDAKDDTSAYSVDSKSKSKYFNQIIKNYNEAISNYKYALSELDNISKSKNADWSNTPAYVEFNKYIKRSEEATVSVLDIIDKSNK